MNIAAKVGLFFLFNIILFKYGINADVLEIPRNIVEPIQNILEIFENWIEENKRTEINDIFIVYFKELGKRIAQILSLPSNNNIWWLWELSILSNSIYIFNQPLGKLEENDTDLRISNKTYRIIVAIRLIKDQIKNYLKKDKKKKGLLEFLSCTITDDKKQPVKSIDDIGSKLESLDEAIQGKFGEIEEDKVHFYTPQNLFFFDIILNEDSIQTLFTNCLPFKWKNYKKDLKQLYFRAMSVLVDEKETYLELITYREYLFYAVKISFYARIKHLMTIYIGYATKNDKQNIKYWDDLWRLTTQLVKDFIKFFHFDDDKNLIEIYNYFSGSNLFSIETKERNIYDLSNGHLSKKTDLYFAHFPNLNSFFKLEMNDLLISLNTSFSELKIHLNNIKNVFEKFDLKIAEVFYNTIPNKVTFV
ncbi:uncharacterized protein LOC126905965 [Daktulosphaira vitifoliae]|uniref:uncharacterized protein LOC126905965 n=1 Tax=Daktulosphaira vitifoliae TaxID=58002 RepID=UPI0021AAE521|nr:uncharacterized protein LOC126905965 [Daktulosphaira vitifoliae]